MDRIERNEPLGIHIDDTDRIIDKLDQLFTHLSLSLLVGALIIGVAFLVPNASQNRLGQSMIIGGLVTITLLCISLLRSKTR